MQFLFGDVTVDDTARQVRRGGGLVHLSPKAFDLLITLLRERPGVVSKEALHRRLWPDTYVADGSLAMLVTEVRAALGESARASQCIRTVHRRGYAFEAQVRETRDAGVPTPAALTGNAAAPAFWLVTASRSVPLPPGEHIVGRDPAADVWLDSPSVSRRHARLVVDADGVAVEDLGSKNGTQVRGARLTASARLADGDVVRFGAIESTVRAMASMPTMTEGGV